MDMKRTVIPRLHDTGMNFRAGMKISLRLKNRGEFAPVWLAPAWHFVLVSCKRMQSHKTEPEWTSAGIKVAPISCKHTLTHYMTRYDPPFNRICTIRHSIARFSQKKSHDGTRIRREVPWYVKFHCEFPCVKFYGTMRIAREFPWYVKFHCDFPYVRFQGTPPITSEFYGSILWYNSMVLFYNSILYDSMPSSLPTNISEGEQ